MTNPTNEDPVLLTVRGTYASASLEAARVLHNQTAGSEAGIAAARELGDLSHTIYAPASGAEKTSKAKSGELLFIDTWLTPQGIMEFFSNENVIQQGNKLFTSRDATVWMPARGAFSFHLPAPKDKPERYVGMLRGTVKSPEQAIEAFRKSANLGIKAARRHGQLSHELFIKLPRPGETGPVEVLGVERWTNLPGALEHYTERSHMAPLSDVFTGPPDPSLWAQAPGVWSEW
jgi:hypothetical protein